MHFYDYLIVATYFGVVIYIGFRTRRSIHNSGDFFLSSRSLPAMTTGLAFMATNSFELMGYVANGAKYGMFTNHLYWIGSVPAMIFSGLVMMRFFYGTKLRSVPEYLRRRFDEKTRGLNAIAFAFLTLFSSGLSLFGLAVVLHTLFHWPIDLCIWAAAGTVLLYVLLGGLRASIYTEVLQLFLMVIGTLPLSVMILYSFGGLSNLLSRLPQNMTHTWTPVLQPQGTPYGGGLLSITLFLGVGSFAYWSTDFLVVQRALAAKDLAAAQKTPIIAAFPKMLFPFLTVIPGLASLLVIPHKIESNYNLALPMMLLHYYPVGLLGIGVTALLASFMSGIAGNVTAFNTVWTYDIYQSYFAPNRSDHHYLQVGRIVTVVGILLAIAAAYTALGFYNIFDYWTLLSTTFLAPPFATFLLGVFTRRVNSAAAFYGMLTGILTTITHFIFYRLGYISYGSELAMGLAGGFYGFAANLVMAFIISRFERPPTNELEGLVYWGTMPPLQQVQAWFRTPVALAVAATTLLIILNIFFW